MSVLWNVPVYVYLVNVSFKFINQSLRHSFLWLSLKRIFLVPNSVILTKNLLDTETHNQMNYLWFFSGKPEWWIDMQNISYFSGNIGNWQMSGFCQKLTANVTWWDIDDPFWKFLLERLSKQLSWFLGVKFVRSLAGACLQYLKLSVRMTQLWQWHIVTVTCSPTESYSTAHHHTIPPLRSARSQEQLFIPRWEFL